MYPAKNRFFQLVMDQRTDTGRTPCVLLMSNIHSMAEAMEFAAMLDLHGMQAGSGFDPATLAVREIIDRRIVEADDPGV